MNADASIDKCMAGGAAAMRYFFSSRDSESRARRMLKGDFAADNGVPVEHRLRHLKWAVWPQAGY